LWASAVEWQRDHRSFGIDDVEALRRERHFEKLDVPRARRRSIDVLTGPMIVLDHEARITISGWRLISGQQWR